ncbi:MAG: bifunctional adenosylcobinamide kinase/adenosylcobinamide-phosphate guanylyltransferase [Eubacteriales bacterium]|nr:bifunctional adenosylcobinamide kinase/adenosylcobinamide-phosphate guanylyltransferase [Eubacteriales bacterium]
MISLIIGGSGSGKSEFAENQLLQITNVQRKFYIATMIAYGEEGRERVERHRRLRAGKGFATIEQPVQLASIEQIDCLNGNAAMLECVSNLLANEMFAEDAAYRRLWKQSGSMEPLARQITKDILEVAKRCQDFFIVSNNVFEDGIVYDEDTRRYQECLALVNAYLTEAVDEVVEVVVGIPIRLKGA